MAACWAFMAAPGGSHWLTFPGAVGRGGVRAMAQRTKSLVNIVKVIAEAPSRRSEEAATLWPARWATLDVNQGACEIITVLLPVLGLVGVVRAPLTRPVINPA